MTNVACAEVVDPVQTSRCAPSRPGLEMISATMTTTTARAAGTVAIVVVWMGAIRSTRIVMTVIAWTPTLCGRPLLLWNAGMTIRTADTRVGLETVSVMMTITTACAVGMEETAADRQIRMTLV